MTAGAHLREERLRQHLSLEEIGRRTSIHLNNLRAIEEDDLASLPAPVFVRGFIRLYARELRIDPLPVLALFDEQYGGARHDVLNHPDILSSESLAESPFVIRRRVVVLLVLLLLAVAIFGYHFAGFSPSRLLQSFLPQQQAAPPPVTTVPEKPTEARRSQTGQQPVPPHPQAAGAVVPAPPPALPFDPTQQLSTLSKQESFTSETAAAVEQSAKAREAAAEEEQTGAVPVAAVPTPSPADTTLPSRPEEPPPPAYRLVADFSQLTWMRVTVDEEPSEEGLYKPGSQQVWTADDGFRLTIGNTGGLTLTLNGQPVAIPASRSKVARLSLP
ncbi:MAG: RodZ domain-containing protein [Thermodesulfobacteriota bacterium]